MVRMNISLPDDLKRQMDEISGVNWSEEARGAFEVVVQRHKPIEGTEMEQVINRLRASKEEAEKQEEGKGFEEGQAWAKNEATFVQLRDIKRSGMSPALETNPYTLFVRAFDLGAWDCDTDSAFDNFRDHQPELAKKMERSKAYSKGFILGAVNLYEQIEDSL
jgi:hypothetical protein